MASKRHKGIRLFLPQHALMNAEGSPHLMYLCGDQAYPQASAIGGECPRCKVAVQYLLDLARRMTLRLEGSGTKRRAHLIER
jgi:hypothetical protein